MAVIDSLLKTREKANFQSVAKHDEMTKHGLLMVAFAMAASVLNYLYQLFMGMLLDPGQYSALISLTSLLLILQVFSQTVLLTVSKFTSILVAENRIDAVNNFWRYTIKKNSIYGMLLFVILIAFSPLISHYLNLDSLGYSLILFSSIPFIINLAVNCGILQGLQKFVVFGSIQVTASFLKVTLGALLVYLGSGIYGGLAAIPISFIVALSLSFYPLRNLSHAGNTCVNTGGFYSYAGLALLSIFALTVMTNIDIVLARHFLSAADAGNYTVVSVLGKIAFYAPAGIVSAMFPKVSRLFEKAGNYRRLYLKALLLTVSIVASVILVYLLFPEQVTKILFGKKYALAARYLFKSGLAMAFFAISFLQANFFLSLNKSKVAFPLLGVALLEVVLMMVFHNDINQLINVLLICALTSVVVMIPFYISWKKRKTP
jgi:O-antigen/teichoic acid export membrane protein